MAGTIGIKIANGDFYPIMEGNSTVKKRLVLTTVHDRQKSVQIDLFKSISKSMRDAQYIGTLLVENIRPRPKGEPSIEMVISGMDGTITAEARDLDANAGAEHHTLNVSLKTVESFGRDTPDFDLGGKRQTSADRYDRENRKFPWLIVAFVMIFILIAAALLWFFFLDGKNVGGLTKGKPVFEQTEPSPPIPPVEPPPPPPPSAVERFADPPPEVIEFTEEVAEIPAEPTPIIQAPSTPPPARPVVTERKRPPAPLSSYKVPAVIPKNGAPYQLRWGDTLWDISEAFYRNPWLYPRIARHNNIRNPDLIIAGRNIRIPPRN